MTMDCFDGRREAHAATINAPKTKPAEIAVDKPIIATPLQKQIADP